MKLISTILFYFAFTSTFAQVWPWFFSETAFKKWLNEKDVKCLKYVSADLEYLNFKNYRYSAEKAIVSYYFDESGVIDFLRKEEIEISLLDDAKTEDNYYFILDSIFLSMPWKMSQADIYILQEYNLSKFYPKIRCMSMYDAVAPDGTVFEESRLVYSKDSSFKFYYHYNLIQEVQFEYGQINSVKDYDLRGDFYIPQLSEISYVPMNDSVSILTLKGYLNFYEKGTYVGRDTIVQYPFYRKNFKNKQKLEFGVRILDTNNVYIHYPLYTAEEWVTATEKIKIDSRAFNAFQMLGAFGDHHWDVSYVFLVQKGAVRIIDKVSDWTIAEFQSGFIEYDKKKYITELDKKTGEQTEKNIYIFIKNEWKLMTSEHLTKNGHLQKHYYKEYERPQDVHGGYLKYYHYGDKKNDVRLTRVILDQNRNPVFVKEEYDKRDTIFRISGDSIYLTKDENMYGHFLIEY